MAWTEMESWKVCFKTRRGYSIRQKRWRIQKKRTVTRRRITIAYHRAIGVKTQRNRRSKNRKISRLTNRSSCNNYNNYALEVKTSKLRMQGKLKRKKRQLKPCTVIISIRHLKAANKPRGSNQTIRRWWRNNSSNGESRDRQTRRVNFRTLCSLRTKTIWVKSSIRIIFSWRPT